jgi:nucleoside-diphosphate-sugar epimerase
MKRVLVTGAAGQIGTELVTHLRKELGEEAVMATDLRVPNSDHPVRLGGPFEPVDCTDPVAMGASLSRFRPDTVFHLAALLSAVGERDPVLTYAVNLGGLMNVLEAARELGFALFTPSSIAAFGPDTPRNPTPQDTLQRPTSMYGVTKVAGELLCDYYHHRFGVEARGLRYPGLISHSAPPGGGTTDWAVEIFHEAVARGRYTSFLRADTQLDMMYMDDAVRASLEVMEADGSRLRHRNAFNVTAFQLTPDGLAAELRRHFPDFTLQVEVDPVRQAIADSWPERLDDSAAREEWGWAPQFGVREMVEAMLGALMPDFDSEAALEAGHPTP